MARLSYSTVVRGLTVVLPLVALALLSTLFLVARTAPEESTLPYIRELQGRAATVGDTVRTPFYTGTTEAGDAVTVRADSVSPKLQDPGTARAERPRADIAFRDGSSLRIDADTGEFISEENRLRLDGNVVVSSSTGYRLQTSALVAELSTGEATSPGAVRVEGPPGTIDAGAMELRRESDENMQLVFTNRVKLVYQPGQRSE